MHTHHTGFPSLLQNTLDTLCKKEADWANPMTTPQLSVIIPTLNEAALLPGLLAQLQQQRGVTLEILIGDAGSQDATARMACSTGVRLIRAPMGRGAQMNAAAREATGEYLLFLHADSGLSNPDLLACALLALEQSQASIGKPCAGHFQLCFVDQPSGYSWLFHYYAKKSTLNRPECCNGDQGWLLSRGFFEKLGGFSEQFPFLEDQDLAARIGQQGTWMNLPGSLTTSARRFQKEGVWRRVLLNAMIMVCWHTGFEEFLRLAPAIYRSQDVTRPVQMTPFFHLFWQLNRAAGRKIAWCRWRAMGRYAWHSVWQIFFLLDLLLFGSRKSDPFPLLDWYDKKLHPLIHFFLFDLFCMIIVLILFVILWAWVVALETASKILSFFVIKFNVNKNND
ncbi:MAG: TIGR04283 family arsenosugar biosynthesis glycosyltransferase [Magnetococcus sp. YQC-5]